MQIGTDIIQIKRIEASLEKFGETFKMKFLNEEERRLSGKIETLAGFWAAKEAIAKALGCGIGAELSFHDILITKDRKGAPQFALSHEATKKFHLKNTSLSISHDGGFAIAVAVIEREDTSL
jgi:holo-[acyl-carrier protein] synthase